MQYSVIRTIGVILLLPIFNPVIKAETPITIHGMDTFTEYSTGKAHIAEIGRRMYAAGFVAATDGNISIRDGGRIWITPTGS